MKWDTRPLGDMADLSLGKMLDERKNSGDPRLYLANVNVRWGSFDLDNLREMRFKADELDRFGLRLGDIVMCEGGEPGRCAIWKEDLPGMMIQKAIHRIRPRSGLDNRFLYYSLLHQGKNGGFAPLFTGSTIKHLPKQQLQKVEIVVPPLPTQQRIAEFLSTYDSLIDNNQRRMALLEEVARQLFEEWFVRLRFPGREHTSLADSHLGPVPKDWNVVRLGTITTKLGSGATPRGGEASYKESGISLIRSLNVYDNQFSDDGLAFLNESQAEDLVNVTVEPRDILLNRLFSQVSG